MQNPSAGHDQCPTCKTRLPRTATVCPQCYTHLPWAKNDRDGLEKLVDAWDATISSIKAFFSAQGQNWQDYQDASRKRANDRHRELLATDTHRGECPQCKSHSINQFRDQEPDDTSLQWAAGCLGCCVFWPFLFLIPFLRRRGRSTLYRRCNACGHQWRV